MTVCPDIYYALDMALDKSGRDDLVCWLRGRPNTYHVPGVHTGGLLFSSLLRRRVSGLIAVQRYPWREARKGQTICRWAPGEFILWLRDEACGR